MTGAVEDAPASLRAGNATTGAVEGASVLRGWGVP